MNNPSSSIFTVKRLTPDIDVSDFHCTEPKLNEYLVEDALRDQTYYYSTTNLVYYNNILVGYFTLITDSMGSDRVDEEIVKKYEYARLPSVKIARLAVDSRYTRQGIGSVIMGLIYGIVLDMIDNIGCRLITVDSKDSAIKFYEKFGFALAVSKQKTDTMSMYLDINVLANTLKQ